MAGHGRQYKMHHIMTFSEFNLWQKSVFITVEHMFVICDRCNKQCPQWLVMGDIQLFILTIPFPKVSTEKASTHRESHKKYSCALLYKLNKESNVLCFY